MFDLGIALKHMQNIRSSTKVDNSSFLKLASRTCVKIFDGQIIQKTPSPATEDNQKKISFPFTGYYKGMLPPDTSRSCAGEDPTQLAGGDTTLDSDDVARRLILTHRIHSSQLPLREPGGISNEVRLNHMNPRISITSCVVQVVSGCTIQVHFGAKIVRPRPACQLPDLW